ncbi:MAG: DNA polymerase III subunit delta [Deltaproteobacteria bacterium]|nr:DNA polymerase III subunit delta [Deltaproteobacteria bacterium]
MSSAAPVVYIYGDETFLVDRALRAIEAEVLAGGASDFNRELFEAPEAPVSKVVAAAKTLPFLGGRRLVLVRNAHLWSAEAWQPLLPYLESPNPSTCLVLVAAELDRRTRHGKALEKLARVVECRHPADRELARWASDLLKEAGIEASRDVAQTLALRVGTDLQLLSREIEKLRAFAGERGRVSAEDVEKLVSESRGTTVFALCDALGRRELAPAARTLRRLTELGEPAVRLLYMIVRHFRSLWIGRELLRKHGGRVDGRSAAPALGVPPFVAENLLRQAKGWKEEELEAAFKAFLRADLALKTGSGKEVLDRLVLELCRPARKADGKD